MIANAISTELTELVERIGRSTVAVRSTSGGGSGVIWSRNGAIVTNAHVVDRDATVVFPDGTERFAKLERRNPERDLALLRIAPTELEPVTPRLDRNLRAGELVIAIGYPLGARGASLGVVRQPLRGDHRYIAADIRLAPGNSGGALADAHGRIVGINSMIVNGTALAIPADAIARFVAADAIAEPFGVRFVAGQIRGVAAYHVTSVTRESAAARAGLRTGDAILAIDGQSVANASLETAAASCALDVQRNGSVHHLIVTRRPSAVAA